MDKWLTTTTVIKRLIVTLEVKKAWQGIHFHFKCVLTIRQYKEKWIRHQGFCQVETFNLNLKNNTVLERQSSYISLVVLAYNYFL